MTYNRDMIFIDNFVDRYQALNEMKKLLILILISTCAWSCAKEVLVEAESFSEKGGWMTDQQFMDVMGSPYLIAHGAGIPVEDARTTVKLPGKGEWHVYVRTFNWTSPWHDGEGPGKFRICIQGDALTETLGVKGDRWEWQYAGVFNAEKRRIEVALNDLSGFDGRCDVILFTREKNLPAADTTEKMRELRKRLIKDYDKAHDMGEYDFVVAGGGVAGMCAAVSAARLGLKVALIHNRPVLGGNNSAEIRVHLGGAIECDPYPELGNLIKEFGHTTIGNANPAECYEDEKKMDFVRNEKNISLFLNMHVTEVEMNGSTITALLARDIETGELFRFRAPLFSDCTGDANVGYLAGADWRTGRESIEETGEPGAVNSADKQVLGASIQWYSKDTGTNSPFPLFEYGKTFTDESVQKVKKGEWTWETGMLRDQIIEAERVRDHGLLVVYSNWSFLKNRSSVRDEYKNLALDWVAYIAGKRESRRLLGDHILTQNDLLDEVPYDDASVPTSWSIDLHFPDPANSRFFPGEEFKSVCTQEHIEIYPIPYRCFYSRNISNLFMAGRNVSVTHVALGTVRVMRTTAMMGEVVGMAASVCHKNRCLPRDVYTEHFSQLQELMKAGCGKNGLENNQKFNVGRHAHRKTGKYGNGPLFKIGVVSDIHHADKDPKIGRYYRMSAKKLSEAVNEFNSQDVDMMISLGDLVDNDIRNYPTIDSVFNSFNGKVYKLLGNHDFIAPFSQERQDSIFRVMGIKDRYQQIRKKGIRLLLLDGTDVAVFSHPEGSEGHKQAKQILDSLKAAGSRNNRNYNGGLGAEQMEWLKYQLERAAVNEEKVICLCHMPMMPSGGKFTLFNSPEVTQLLATSPWVKAVLTGHHHPGSYDMKDGIHYLSLQGMVQGEDNSYSIVEVYEDKIIVRGYGREETRRMEFKK